jgi:hypothetical protein
MSLTLLGVSNKTTGGPFIYMLDVYPTAAIAYSVRKLNSAYAGPCVRVRRDSDNAELDIPFTNNKLDTAVLSSFCSGTNGTVTTWYDQSGNSKNLLQSASASQPLIYSSATGIQKDNNIPTLVHGVGKDMSAINVPVNGLTQMSINVTGRGINSGNQGSGMGMIYWLESGIWGSIYQAHNIDFLLGRFGTGQVNNNIGGTLPVSTDIRISNMIKESTNEYFYYNNILRTAPTGRLSTIANTGSVFTTNYNGYDCRLQEIIVYNFSILAVLNNFNTDTNNYFNIY